MANESRIITGPCAVKARHRNVENTIRYTGI
jgi:hypothetical protein